MNTYSNVLIVSAELSHLKWYRNAKNTFKLYKWLKTNNIAFSFCTGSYKDEQEISFLTLPNTPDIAEQITFFVFNEFGQESVLRQDANGQVYLEFYDGSTELLGEFKEVSKAEAKKHDAWTLVEESEQYFIVE